jgi:hypothetical protein
LASEGKEGCCDAERSLVLVAGQILVRERERERERESCCEEKWLPVCGMFPHCISE